jgi:hypothetical protein
MPVRMLEPTQNAVLKAVNGDCVRCRHRLAWIVIRGKRQAHQALYRTC